MGIWLTSMSMVESVGEILGLLVVFILILVAAFYTSRWVARHSGDTVRGVSKNQNMEVIETYRIGPNRYLQIVRAAGKYLLLAVTKDQVTMLTELPEDGIIKESGPEGQKLPSFAEVLKNLAGTKDKKQGKK